MITIIVDRREQQRRRKRKRDSGHLSLNNNMQPVTFTSSCLECSPCTLIIPTKCTDQAALLSLSYVSLLSNKQPGVCSLRSSPVARTKKQNGANSTISLPTYLLACLLAFFLSFFLSLLAWSKREKPLFPGFSSDNRWNRLLAETGNKRSRFKSPPLPPFSLDVSLSYYLEGDGTELSRGHEDRLLQLLLRI